MPSLISSRSWLQYRVVTGGWANGSKIQAVNGSKIQVVNGSKIQVRKV
jgi:hypothetical protein